jgi:hypothetical protein
MEKKTVFETLYNTWCACWGNISDEDIRLTLSRSLSVLDEELNEVEDEFWQFLVGRYESVIGI